MQMSLRKSRLCDVSVPRYTSDNKAELSCDQPALGACFVCEKDVCREHTTHAQGGLVVSLFVLVGNKACEHDGSGKPQRHSIADNFYHLCFSCKSAIDKLGVERAQIVDELRDAARTGIKAALTAKGLE